MHIHKLFIKIYSIIYTYIIYNIHLLGLLQLLSYLEYSIYSLFQIESHVLFLYIRSLPIKQSNLFYGQ